MHILRIRLLGLLLAIFVGLGLAATGLGHRLPSAAEQVAQAWQVAGLPGDGICGQSQGDKTAVNHPCPACLAGQATLDPTTASPAPTQLELAFRLALPRGIASNPQQRLPGHRSRAPPFALI